MIGNDIVDLKYISESSNWQRPRFLDKVFTRTEQAYISTSENQHLSVWLLWSMKEAAYKVHVQRYGSRFFNPKRLECELTSEKNGLVQIENSIYYTSSICTEDYVYTIAKLNTTKKVKTSIFKTEKQLYFTQSISLKAKLINSISKKKQFDAECLEIKKTAMGIPKLFYNSKQLPIDFSLTHCGRFSGFVY